MKGVVAVTGANGFVGRPLCRRLAADGWTVRRVVRVAHLPNAEPGDFAVGEIGAYTEWGPVLEGVDAVVHLAARTHVLHDQAANPLAAYRSVNVEGTARLTAACVAAGVRSFVYMSSVKVNGETTDGIPFNEATPPAPEDAYGITKLEAENIVRASGLNDTIMLRPPLVYGPGVKANFLRLMHLVARRLPLPLASIHNKRSLIYVGNLVDAAALCVDNPCGVGQAMLVRDAEQPSTAELIRQIGLALGVTPRLFPFPPPLLAMAAAVTGRRSEWQRLSSSIEMKSIMAHDIMGWTPPYTMAAGLAATAQWYHQEFPGKSTT